MELKSAQSRTGETPFAKSHPTLFREWTGQLAEPLRPHLDRAMRYYFKSKAGDCFDRGYAEIRSEFDAVQSIAVCLATETRRAERKVDFDFSPEGIVRAEKEFTAIRPDLEDLRRAILGRQRPFGTIDRAKAFLRRNGSPRYSPAIIEFAGQTTAHDPRSPLGRLAATSSRIDAETPFTQAGVVAFVLMGLAPIPRKYRVTAVKGLPFRKGGDRPVPLTIDNITAIPARFVDVRIYRPLTDKEFKRLAVDSRVMVKRARKTMSAKALDIHRFFDGFGGPPATGKMDYWDRALKAWRHAHPHSTIRTISGIRFAYRRLMVRR